MRLFADLLVEVCYVLLCRIENFVLVTGLSHGLFHTDFSIVLEYFVVVELKEAYDSRGKGFHGERFVALDLIFDVVEERANRAFKGLDLIG